MKTTIASTTRWLSRSPRHFRWREILENGTTLAEIAAAEKINESYVGRVLRLTLLPPDVAEPAPAAANKLGPPDHCALVVAYFLLRNSSDVGWLG